LGLTLLFFPGITLIIIGSMFGFGNYITYSEYACADYVQHHTFIAGKSQCGYILNATELYCCDYNEILNSYGDYTCIITDCIDITIQYNENVSYWNDQISVDKSKWLIAFYIGIGYIGLAILGIILFVVIAKMKNFVDSIESSKMRSISVNY